MALRKTKTINGVSGDYWVIMEKMYSKDMNATLVSFRCYASSEIRSSGIYNFIAMPEFFEYRQLPGDLTLAECYAASKTDFFSDATDC